MKWRVHNYKPNGSQLTKNINIKGVFTLDIGPIRIKGMELKQFDSKRFVNFPSAYYPDENGTMTITSSINIPDWEMFDSFNDWCIAELAKIVPEIPSKQQKFKEIIDDGSIPF